MADHTTFPIDKIPEFPPAFAQRLLDLMHGRGIIQTLPASESFDGQKILDIMHDSRNHEPFPLVGSSNFLSDMKNDIPLLIVLSILISLVIGMMTLMGHAG